MDAKIWVVYIAGLRPFADMNSMGPVLEPSAKRLLWLEVGVPLIDLEPCCGELRPRWLSSLIELTSTTRSPV